MSANSNKQLHWSQRVALVRHNLHAASRTGDFGFFRALQAAGFMEGTNHVATLSAELGDEADTILAAMDNLNAGLAYLHQDAFKNVYDTLKNDVREEEQRANKSKLYVDVTMQKNMADMAIDKMSSSAIAIINQQPENVQDCAANVWVTSSTLVADCMEVSLEQLDALDEKVNDFIRLEESWNTVKASVVCAITGLKGIFSLMDPSNPQESPRSSARNSSIASASGAVFRRLSNAFISSTATSSRNNSIASASQMNHMAHAYNNHVGDRTGSVSFMAPVYRTPNYIRNSISAGWPTSMPPSSDPGPHEFPHSRLSMIPPTPASGSDMDPFDSVPPDEAGPPLPEIPDIGGFPALPSPTAMGMEQRKLGQAVM